VIRQRISAQPLAVFALGRIVGLVEYTFNAVTVEIRKGGFAEQPGSITPRGTFRCAGDKQETRAERDLEEKWSTPPPSGLKTRRASCASSFSHSLASPPKHIYHSIICICALVAHREHDRWAVDTLSAPHVGEGVSRVCDKIAELRPQLHDVQRQ